MTTALVTGGSGFIGSNLCERLLAEGKRVVAIDDLSSGRIGNLVEARGYGKQFTFYNVDVRADGLPTIFERHQPEVVHHLAARPEAESLADPATDASVTVMGLLNVLECAAAVGTAKIVYASSASVYGETRKLPSREIAIASSKPLSPGGVARRLAEDYLRYYQRYRGLDYTVLVLANVYGPRQESVDGRAVVRAVADRMLAGDQPTVYGDGNQTRDYVFIDDAVHAFALAAEHGSGRAVNIGTGVETSVVGVYRMLAALTGYRGEPSLGPPAKGEPRRSVLDNELAERELGWKPWTHLEDGLAETVAGLRGV